MGSRSIGLSMIIIGLLLLAVTAYDVALKQPIGGGGFVPATTVTVTRNIMVPITHTVTRVVNVSSGVTITKTLVSSSTTTITLPANNSVITYLSTVTVPSPTTVTTTRIVTVAETFTQTLTKTITTTTTVSVAHHIVHRLLVVNLSSGELNKTVSSDKTKVVLGDREYLVWVNATLSVIDDGYLVSLRIVFQPGLDGDYYRVLFSGTGTVVKAEYVDGGYVLSFTYSPGTGNYRGVVVFDPLSNGDSIIVWIELPRNKPSVYRPFYWYLVFGDAGIYDLPVSKPYVVGRDNTIVFAYRSGYDLVIVKLAANALLVETARVAFWGGELNNPIGIRAFGDKYLFYAYGSITINYTVVNGLLFVLMDENLNLLSAKLLPLHSFVGDIGVLDGRVFVLLYWDNGFTVLSLDENLDVTGAWNYNVTSGEEYLQFCRIKAVSSGRVAIACTLGTGNGRQYLVMAGIDSKGRILWAYRMFLKEGGDYDYVVTDISGNDNTTCIVLADSFFSNNGYIIVYTANGFKVLRSSLAPIMCASAVDAGKVYVAFYSVVDNRVIIAEINVPKHRVEKTLATPSTGNEVFHGLQVVGDHVYFAGVSFLYDIYGDVLFMKLPLNLTVKLGYQPLLNISLEKTLLETQQMKINVNSIPGPYNPIALSGESIILEKRWPPNNWFITYLEPQ